MLIPQLPPESATATQIRLAQGDAGIAFEREHDPETEQWSRVEHLLASVKDELAAFRFAYATTHSKHKPKHKFEPTPRPGVKPKRKRKPRLSQGQVNALELYLDTMQGEPEPEQG